MHAYTYSHVHAGANLERSLLCLLRSGERDRLFFGEGESDTDLFFRLRWRRGERDLDLDAERETDLDREWDRVLLLLLLRCLSLESDLRGLLERLLYLRGLRERDRDLVYLG